MGGGWSWKGSVAVDIKVQADFVGCQIIYFDVVIYSCRVMSR